MKNKKFVPWNIWQCMSERLREDCYSHRPPRIDDGKDEESLNDYLHRMQGAPVKKDDDEGDFF